MSWKTVYIDENCHLSLQYNNLRVQLDEEYLNIPIADIQIVILAHDKMTITLPIINKLIESNVGIVTTNKSRDPIGMFLPFNGHSQVFKKVNEQINWSKIRKKQLWKIIIEQKIESEIQCLHRVGVDNTKILKGYRINVKSNDTTNREGLAAREYFRLMYGEAFIRGNDDNINYALNYGYKIIASYISRYIASRGYLTQLGIFHIGSSNAYNLTYDFIEIFRYTIDLWVYHYVYKNNKFELLNKKGLLQIMGGKIKYKNKQYSVEHVIESVINDYFRYLNCEIDKIEFPEYGTIRYEAK